MVPVETRTECKYAVHLVHSARKAGAPPEEYLSHFALACHRAKAAVSGALEPLYRLHASRLRLMMGPDPDLPVIARFCFLKSTAKQVCSHSCSSHLAHPLCRFHGRCALV